MEANVSVTIVTHNSERYIGACLESLWRQTWPLEIVVVDNASTDGTWPLLERCAGRIRALRNPENRGFAAAQNQAIREAGGEWILVLNPDVVLRPDFLAALLSRAQRAGRDVGTLCGRLMALPENLDPAASRHFDSTGIYFTPALRHFDRGCRAEDRGEYRQAEYVFGATGAAALYRRAMIADISVPGAEGRAEFFDESFFCYREDADVAWRAQLLGWKCLYCPEAVGYHVRAVLPTRRADVPAAMNMHSVKNRFLMRIKNVTARLYFRHLAAITGRDLGILAWCLVRERTSLEAFVRLRREWRGALAKRRWIMAHRRADPALLERWFRWKPACEPLEEPAALAGTAALGEVAARR